MGQQQQHILLFIDSLTKCSFFTPTCLCLVRVVLLKKSVEWFSNHPLSVRFFFFLQSLKHKSGFLSWVVDYIAKMCAATLLFFFKQCYRHGISLSVGTPLWSRVIYLLRLLAAFPWLFCVCDGHRMTRRYSGDPLTSVLVPSSAQILMCVISWFMTKSLQN